MEFCKALRWIIRDRPPSGALPTPVFKKSHPTPWFVRSFLNLHHCGVIGVGKRLSTDRAQDHLARLRPPRQEQGAPDHRLYR